MMTRRQWLVGVCGLLPCAVLGFAVAMAADFEVTGPDGRRILLKDDKTWQYVDDKGKGKAAEAPKDGDKPKIPGEAVLTLERKAQLAGGCLFGMRLANGFPHIIQSLFPMFSAMKANDVVYDTVSAGFQAVKPGDSQARDILFRGMSCKDIVRVQVGGGDRCVMGDLDRFSFDSGACLGRVRVVPSDLVRFDK